MGSKFLFSVLTTVLTGVFCASSQEIKDDIVLGPEAKAARAGSAYGWDIAKVRAALERRVKQVEYTGLKDGCVAGIPTPTELESKTTNELFGMCRHWNPAMLRSVSDELQKRGASVYEIVRANATSSDPAIRVACATAISSLLKAARDPEVSKLVSANMRDIIKMISTFCGDSDVRVRRAGTAAYAQVARMFKGASAEAKSEMIPLFVAVWQQNATEKDPHLCQDVMVSVGRCNLQSVMPKSKRAATLSKILLNQTFPRGAGTTVNAISRLSEDEIEACLPALLKHFKRPCLRDSMFFPGGRPTAFKLIVDRRAKYPELFKAALQAANAVNKEPWVDFGGRHRRSMQLLWNTLGELGPVAKPALPGMQHLLDKAKARLANETDKQSRRYKQALEYVEYGQSIIDRICK